jgi:predicted HAD superfamily Cof-like phosphohydrolase
MTEELNQQPREAFAAAIAARMLVKVAEFNREVVALPIPETPQVLGEQRRTWANAALQEELKEFNDAADAGDVLEAADALIDLVYFALGRLVEMGVPATAVMDEVQRANMDKERGELSKRPGSMGHDAIKPTGWQAPDHAWLLGFTLADLRELRQLRAEAAEREALSPVWLRLQALREAKGKDYNDVPGGRDAYFPFGHFSYAHMVNTKNLRLQSLLAAMSKGRPVNFEGILDTVEDLVNYATYYAEAMRDGRLQQDSLAIAGGEA